MPHQCIKTPWNGFKVVGDNLDITVRPQSKRVDNKTESLHFFQSFAFRDRIDLSHASEEANPFLKKRVSDLPLDDLLPSLSDDQTLLSNISTLISRVLCDELSFFTMTFEEVINNHISHGYSNEMSQKSETVGN